ncbi:hypothetical protein [Paractinoplanes abujensis]|uniref:Uncharacterized protein n=1 Tax=Paractinoplanes abujensis TaxID=882441 RepID=A0A7W7CWZ8_9ACTN|nr:hypothetical protein [Actinoplanes abujensis]MBB4696019.1 hypothetical protein [Actinoplanes abujensis]
MALKHHGFLTPTDRREWQPEPEAVGVGPDGTAFAVWPHRRQPDRKQVTAHAGGTGIVTSATVETELKVSFVQPLPGGQFLLAAARGRAGASPNAQIWTSEGHLVRAGYLGDAIEEILTTPSGDLWIGYFDEAMGGSGPQAHGLVRFTHELVPDWLYPADDALPAVFDCYALNVAGESAYCCPYTDFHLISITGNVPRDLGPAPHRSAHSLLMRNAQGALIGGWGPEYDLVTPLRPGGQGVEPAGRQCRIVLPDGTEAQRVRYTGRGSVLHAIARNNWYSVMLDDIAEVAQADRH